MSKEATLIKSRKQAVKLDTSTLNDHDMLTVEQVAAWLQMTPSWVREHASGRRRPFLPSYKLGKFRRFRYDTLKEWHKGLRS